MSDNSDNLKGWMSDEVQDALSKTDMGKVFEPMTDQPNSTELLYTQQYFAPHRIMRGANLWLECRDQDQAKFLCDVLNSRPLVSVGEVDDKGNLNRTPSNASDLVEYYFAILRINHSQKEIGDLVSRMKGGWVPPTALSNATRGGGGLTQVCCGKGTIHGCCGDPVPAPSNASDLAREITGNWIDCENKQASIKFKARTMEEAERIGDALDFMADSTERVSISRECAEQALEALLEARLSVYQSGRFTHTKEELSAQAELKTALEAASE